MGMNRNRNDVQRVRNRKIAPKDLCKEKLERERRQEQERIEAERRRRFGVKAQSEQDMGTLKKVGFPLASLYKQSEKESGACAS